MNKQIIKFKATDFQRLERVGKLKSFAPETVNYIEAEFTLAPFWRDCHRLYAAWGIGDERAFTDIPESGKVVIPHELLDIPGTLMMNIVAVTYEDPAAEEKKLEARMVTYPVEVLRITRKENGK